MSTADRKLQNALRALTRGGMQEWSPELTTRQQRRNAALREAFAAQGLGGNYFNADLFAPYYTADVLPPADDPAWTLVQVGNTAALTATVSAGVLTIEDDQ